MPPTSDPSEYAPLLQLATALALESAHILTTAGRPATIERKRTSVDLVTELDRRVERHVVDRLHHVRPDDGILGEEGGAADGVSGVRWLIDPIDGTTNFVYDYPGYAISIGVEVGGQRVVGVVHDVVLAETFAASRGGGATLNGRVIRVSSQADLATALVGTGFSYGSDIRATQAEVLRHVLPRVRDIRRRGSAALDLCWVACGRLDAFYERDHGGPWDIAAGEVIVREAGGLIGGLVGGLDGPALTPGLVLASGRALFEELRALLRAAGASPDADR